MLISIIKSVWLLLNDALNQTSPDVYFFHHRDDTTNISTCILAYRFMSSAKNLKIEKYPHRFLIKKFNDLSFSFESFESVHDMEINSSNVAVLFKSRSSKPVGMKRKIYTRSGGGLQTAGVGRISIFGHCHLMTWSSMLISFPIFFTSFGFPKCFIRKVKLNLADKNIWLLGTNA